MILENCNNDNTPDGTVPLTQIPYHLYRVDYDIRPTYGSVAASAQSVLGLDKTRSGPSCWAYADMLEVGVTTPVCTAKRHARGYDAAAFAEAAAKPLPPVLTQTESRTHFAIWCVLSQPLTLSFNLSDATVMDAVYPIIANAEAIAVNQGWADHPGDAIFASTDTVVLQDCTPIWAGASNCTIPAMQIFAKPLPGGRAAVVVANHGVVPSAAAVDLAKVPGTTCGTGPCAVRDVHAHKDLGSFTGTVPVAALASHDSAFLVIS